MSYGLPYMGSKSKICDWLLAHLPPADTFVDLFAGGCAVTHAAMVSGRYRQVIANDIQGDVLELFSRAVAEGLQPEDWRPVSREEFFLHAPTDPLIQLVWAFGNSTDSYLYGQEIERQKLLAHTMIVADNIRDRYSAFQAFIKMLGSRREHYGDLPSICRLARIQSLHGLARIRSMLRISTASYDACPYLPPQSSSVIYADPPYIHTTEYTPDTFNYDRFYNWLRSVPFPVYVSEYQMPSDFVSIAQTSLACTLSHTRNDKTVIEHLFLHERFARPDTQGDLPLF